MKGEPGKGRRASQGPLKKWSESGSPPATAEAARQRYVRFRETGMIKRMPGLGAELSFIVRLSQRPLRVHQRPSRLVCAVSVIQPIAEAPGFVDNRLIAHVVAAPHNGRRHGHVLFARPPSWLECFPVSASRPAQAHALGVAKAERGAAGGQDHRFWRHYAPLFREYSTGTIPPELLAALAQVEGAGDPLARTYWRWRLTGNPFTLYAPASSSVGMYQITDAAFAEARGYCIRDHTVVEDDCWFNGLYWRIVPSHAVELAAIFLDRHLTAILSLKPNGNAGPEQKEDLAAVIYLCGAGPGEAFAHRGFKLTPGERCGDHDVATYLAHVRSTKWTFLGFAANP